MLNRDKIILDLCGGTGSWSKPYKDAGYDVRLITLPDYDVRTYVPPYGVYGVLAAPPCTEFSMAKNFHGRKHKRNLIKGMNVVNACLRIIFQCYEYGLTFWAMENPKGLLRRFFDDPLLTFDPCDFGDPYKKKTDVFGKFNLPKKNPVPPLTKLCRFAHIPNRNISSQYYGKLSRQERRAVTPAGFARAFFEANR